MSDIRVHRYADSDAAGKGVAALLARRLTSGPARNVFKLCVSDGLSGVFSELRAAVVATGAKPRRLDLWWSDDGFVDVTDPARVSTKTLAALGGLGLTPGHIHPMPTTAGNPDADAAAMLYAAELGETAFDLALLEIADDGGLAGVAPGSPAFTEPAPHKVVAVQTARGERLAMSLTMLARTAEVWLIAAGDAIAPSLKRVVDGDESLPAGVLRGRKATHLFADDAAAANLPWHVCQL